MPLFTMRSCVTSKRCNVRFPLNLYMAWYVVHNELAGRRGRGYCWVMPSRLDAMLFHWLSVLSSVRIAILSDASQSPLMLRSTTLLASTAPLSGWEPKTFLQDWVELYAHPMQTTFNPSCQELPQDDW
jgi:hypothetical protein